MKPETFEPAETNAGTYQKALNARAPVAEDSAPAGSRAPLTIRNIGEILALPDNPSDVILSNGYIERGSRTAICGMGAIGKSRLMMQLAMMHRAGLPFLAWDTRSPQLRWLFLQTENGNRRLRKDLAAMLTGFTPAQQTAIKAGISIHTLEGEDDGFLILSDPDNLQRTVDAIQGSAADIVVFDPLRDCTGDDLNKDTVMGETLRTMRSIVRTGDPMRTLLVIHHAGEGRAGIAKATGYDRGAFGRNSKVLKTWARAQFNIAPATADDNSQIIIASGKCNDYEEFAPVCARLNPETMLYELVEGFDFDAWRESLNAEKQQATTDKLTAILREAGGGLEKNETIARLQSGGIGKHTARGLIAKAVESSEIEETMHSRPGKKPAVYLTLKT